MVRGVGGGGDVPCLPAPPGLHTPPPNPRPTNKNTAPMEQSADEQNMAMAGGDIKEGEGCPPPPPAPCFVSKGMLAIVK